MINKTEFEIIEDIGVVITDRMLAWHTTVDLYIPFNDIRAWVEVYANLDYLPLNWLFI